MGRRPGPRSASLQGAVLTVHVVRWADAAEVPWRNGGGLTRELVVVGHDPFDWRLSAATIAADGPFSVFPGIDRILVLLSGDGVRLWFSDDGSCETVDRAGAWLEFGGERPIEATLVGGGTTDLNLMWRRDRFAARVQPDLAAPGGAVVVVHVRSGSCTVESSDGTTVVRLGVGDTAWWSDAEGRVADATGDVVRFDLMSGA